MSALLGKAGKKLFERHLEQYAPQDPLYEFYTDAKGKKKRRKRVLPLGLSARDAKILKSVQRRAHYLDKGFSICGLRFGWTFLIGLIPVVGDAADASLNYLLVVRKARQADIPPWLLRRMLLHNAVSAGVGFVPFVGDLVLAMYKANSRNAALLEEFLRIRGEEYLKLREEEATAEPENGEKKKRKRVSEKDAEQVKPGAGIVQGEVVPTEPTGAVASSSTPTGAGPSSEKRAPADGKKAFGSYFSKPNKSTARKSLPDDKGKFVEDVEPVSET